MLWCSHQNIQISVISSYFNGHFLKIKIIPSSYSEIGFWRIWHWGYSHFRKQRFDNIIKMFRSPLLWVIFRHPLWKKNFFKEIEVDFWRDDSEPIIIVTIGYKAVMTSSKWLDFNYFALFSCPLLKSKYYSKRLK